MKTSIIFLIISLLLVCLVAGPTTFVFAEGGGDTGGGGGGGGGGADGGGGGGGLGAAVEAAASAVAEAVSAVAEAVSSAVEAAASAVAEAASAVASAVESAVDAAAGFACGVAISAVHALDAVGAYIGNPGNAGLGLSISTPGSLSAPTITGIASYSDANFGTSYTQTTTVAIPGTGTTQTITSVKGVFGDVAYQSSSKSEPTPTAPSTPPTTPTTPTAPASTGTGTLGGDNYFGGFEGGPPSPTPPTPPTPPSNHAPTATNLTKNNPDWCVTPFQYILNWTFSDSDGDTQASKQIQVSTNSGFSTITYDSGKVDNSTQSYSLPIGSGLQYNTTYYWRVKVWDSRGLESLWSQESFTTPKHAYPTPAFTSQPVKPAKGQSTQFFDQSVTFGSSAISGWSWTFQDANPSSSSLQNSSVIFGSEGQKTITLSVTDSDGYSCSKTDGKVVVGIFNPTWQEIAPF